MECVTQLPVQRVLARESAVARVSAELCCHGVLYVSQVAGGRPAAAPVLHTHRRVDAVEEVTVPVPTVDHCDCRLRQPCLVSGAPSAVTIVVEHQPQPQPRRLWLNVSAVLCHTARQHPQAVCEIVSAVRPVGQRPLEQFQLDREVAVLSARIADDTIVH